MQKFHSIRPLTLSSIYTHFNTLEKKPLENIVENGEIAQNEQFHPFPQCFLCNLYRSKNPLIAIFQLLSTTSLNLGRSQNGVLGNGLTLCYTNPTLYNPEKKAF